MDLGIIGGTGLEGLIEAKVRRRFTTPFGEVEATIGTVDGVEVVFIPRHGYRHEHLPHKVNYRAHIYGLRKFEVRKVLATSAVGSMNPSFAPGDLVILDQVIDCTKKREYTFYDDETVHVDFTEPFCPDLREILYSTTLKLDLRTWDHGTYVCVEGPRFETKAEIEVMRFFGGDLVGMTLIPEVVLAREFGLCYASIGIVTNWAAGVQDKVSHQEVMEMMDEKRKDIARILREAVPRAADVPRRSVCMEMDEKAEEYLRRLEA